MKIKKWNTTTSTWEQDYPEVNVSSIVATGTASSSTFLRGDGAWVGNVIVGSTFAGAFSPPGGGTNTGVILYGDYYGWHTRAIGSAGQILTVSSSVPTWTTPSFAASVITSGTMATARLGSGTASSSTFLRGDSTWSTDGIATYSTATLYIKRIYSRTATSGATWTERYDAGTGNGTTVSTTDTWTAIALGYTPSATTDDEQFLIEFSNNTSTDLEKGICMVGYGTFSSTAGMSLISYDAYETVTSGQLKLAKYYAQWRLNGSNIEFRYGSKVVW